MYSHIKDFLSLFAIMPTKKNYNNFFLEGITTKSFR